MSLPMCGVTSSPHVSPHVWGDKLTVSQGIPNPVTTEQTIMQARPLGCCCWPQGRSQQQDAQPASEPGKRRKGR